MRSNDYYITLCEILALLIVVNYLTFIHVLVVTKIVVLTHFAFPIVIWYFLVEGGRSFINIVRSQISVMKLTSPSFDIDFFLYFDMF